MNDQNSQTSRDKKIALLRERKAMLQGAIRPHLENRGFKSVRKDHFGTRIGPREICFERCVENLVEHITIGYDKYDASMFQLRLLVRDRSPVPDGTLLDARNITPNNRKYYHFWGVRWWNIRRNKAWQQAVEKILACVPQMFEFFEGKLGPNISKDPRS